MLDLTTEQLLTTTRAVRRRLDFECPVAMSLIRECLEIALQAPSGSNVQGWHFLVVTDPGKRKALAELYRRSFESYKAMPHSVNARADSASPEDRRTAEGVRDSSAYLAANIERVPVHVIPCIEGRADREEGPTANRRQASLFGSILPAVWSFMLAGRCRGLGTVWTTPHLMYEKEAAELLGVPYDDVTQVALIPVAFTKGTEFERARRKRLDDVLHLERW